MTLIARIQSFLNDEEGASAIEYSLIAAVISLGLLAALTPVKTAIGAVFARILTALNSALAP